MDERSVRPTDGGVPAVPGSDEPVVESPAPEVQAAPEITVSESVASPTGEDAKEEPLFPAEFSDAFQLRFFSLPAKLQEYAEAGELENFMKTRARFLTKLYEKVPQGLLDSTFSAKFNDAMNKTTGLPGTYSFEHELQPTDDKEAILGIYHQLNEAWKNDYLEVNAGENDGKITVVIKVFDAK
ncbi:MAG: hypothetical protein WC107_00460 [Patescibacteria group bacterium]